MSTYDQITNYTRETLNQLDDRVEQLEADLEQTQVELQTAVEYGEQEHNKVVALTAQVVDLQAQITDLTAKAHTDATTIAGLQIQVAALTAERDALQAELDALNNPDALFQPIDLGNDATDAEIRAAFGIPADRNLVRWTFGDQDLEKVHAQLKDNDVLVLFKGRDYWIDSSKGFMASGVKEVDGTGPDGKKDGSRVPVVHNPRLWFEMTRARAGIVALGPVVINVTDSGWTAPRQPVRKPDGSESQTVYYTNGTTGTLSGAQNTLIGYSHPSPIFANFIIKGRDFGGVAYNTIKRTGGTGVEAIVRRVTFDQSWRSHAGTPNGEAGALTFNGGRVLIENCDLITPSAGYAGGSPIMWNNNTGVTVRNVRSRGTKPGMWTFWRCGGKNVFENVSLQSSRIGVNIEQNLAGFELDWTTGANVIGMGTTESAFHFSTNPSGGPPKIALHGVTCSPNGYTPSAMCVNVYTTFGVAKRSYISCDTMPVSCVPDVAWVN